MGDIVTAYCFGIAGRERRNALHTLSAGAYWHVVFYKWMNLPTCLLKRKQGQLPVVGRMRIKVIYIHPRKCNCIINQSSADVFRV